MQMKQLNICIDIDGTITDPYYFLEPLNKYFSKNITKEQVTQYSLPKVFGISEEEFWEFYEKNKYEVHSSQKLRKHVKTYLDKLKDDNNLYFITARDKSVEVVTLAYLKSHNLPYNEIYLLGSHYKVEKARELNCSVFIEDSYENAEALALNGFKVILLDTYYNRKPLRDNIIRVENWQEVYNIIDEMLLQEKAV